MNTKYEIKVLKYKTGGAFGGKVDTEQIEKDLNELGSQGWDFVKILETKEAYGSTKDIVAMFKRRLISSQ